MAVLTGKTASVYATSSALPLTNEALGDTGDHTTYIIANTAKRVLDRSVIPNVDTSPDGTTWTPASPTLYTLKWLSGRVIFNAAQSATTQVRITGSYLPSSKIAEATEWSVSLDQQLVKATTLGSIWRLQQATIKDASIKFKQWYVDDRYVTSLGNLSVVTLYADEPNGIGFRAYGYLKPSAITVPEEDLISVDVDFDVKYELETIP